LASVKMNGFKGKIKPRVLLVVSNDLIRDVFKELFERSGYNTVAVDTAKDGFKAINDECFDIVICDFDLYDSTGVEFFESVKDVCPDRKNILMITYGDEVDITEEKRLNIQNIIEKPFPFEELLRIVEELS
jgi:two-component system, NtrC family, response regulator HydG